MGEHVEVDNKGRIHSFSDMGKELISVCQLDSPVLTESRERLVGLIDRLSDSEDEKAVSLLDYYLSPPSNRPRLSKLRPPGGNLRPEGIE